MGWMGPLPVGVLVPNIGSMGFLEKNGGSSDFCLPEIDQQIPGGQKDRKGDAWQTGRFSWAISVDGPAGVAGQGSGLDVFWWPEMGSRQFGPGTSMKGMHAQNVPHTFFCQWPNELSAKFVCENQLQQPHPPKKTPILGIYP